MKIDRLIGILSILLQKEKITAPELAAKFEVSRRTINRDIEHLCKAGIPVVTTCGKNGGISIVDGYKIDKTLLTSSDMKAIFAGLKSLDSVSGTNRYQQLMDKLSPDCSGGALSGQYISIDLSSWYKSTLAPKIEKIRQAIERREKIAFDYYRPKGESHRKLEPYRLVFKWSSWYVWGYCVDKEDFRLFKLNRMPEIENTGEVFEARVLPESEISPVVFAPGQLHARILFEPEAKWRLIDDFGLDSFTEQPDGMLLFAFDFMDVDNLFSWLLSFGSQAELLEPEELRDIFFEMIQKMMKKYK